MTEATDTQRKLENFFEGLNALSAQIKHIELELIFTIAV